jgi:hypothetical protein
LTGRSVHTPRSRAAPRWPPARRRPISARARARVAHKTVEAADRAHEKRAWRPRACRRNEIEEAGKLAGSISKKYPSLSQTE